LPLHPSAVEALRHYQTIRRKRFPFTRRFFVRLTNVDCLTLRYGARSALRKRTRRQYWDGGVPVQWPSIWEYQRQPFSVSGQNDEVGNEVGNCHSKYVLILILRQMFWGVARC